MAELAVFQDFAELRDAVLILAGGRGSSGGIHLPSDSDQAVVHGLPRGATTRTIP